MSTSGNESKSRTSLNIVYGNNFLAFHSGTTFPLLLINCLEKMECWPIPPIMQPQVLYVVDAIPGVNAHTKKACSCL